MFLPKQAPSSAMTSHASELLMTQTENESAALVSRATTVSPAPATTANVSRLRSSSRPGSARLSQNMRAPPMTTDSAAARSMYGHSEDWRNATVPDTPTGPRGSSADTI